MCLFFSYDVWASLKESRRTIEAWNPWTPQDCSEKCGHPEKGHFWPFIVSGEITTGIQACEFFWLNITKEFRHVNFLHKSMLLLCLMCASTVLYHKKFIKKFFRRYYPTKTQKKISSSQFTRILSQNVKLSCFCHLKIRLIWSVVESFFLRDSHFSKIFSSMETGAEKNKVD